MSISPAVVAVLERARDYGDVGEQDLERAMAHALGFFPEGVVASGAAVLDLGSGGGLPALPLMDQWPETVWSLVESRTGRAERLAVAINVLGWGDRATVYSGRAEELGHGPLRGTMEVVTARSFGRPAVVAECAAGFLAVGGRLIVSEPPDSEGRWPAAGVASLGFELAERWSIEVGHFQSLRLVEAPSNSLPRRPGVAKRRPLF